MKNFKMSTDDFIKFELNKPRTYMIKCNVCNHKFHPKVKTPVVCPNCKNYLTARMGL